MKNLTDFEFNKFKNFQKEQLTIMENLINRIENLSRENKELKDEAYKDKELSQMKERLSKLEDECRRGFTISKEEDEALLEWQNSHIRKKHWDNIHNRPLSFGAVGGNFSYEFTPTGIGVIGTVKCTCGECFTFQDL